jgi:hypothetical protein
MTNSAYAKSNEMDFCLVFCATVLIIDSTLYLPRKQEYKRDVEVPEVVGSSPSSSSLSNCTRCAASIRVIKILCNSRLN